MKKIIYLIGLFLIIETGAFAQGMFGISYDIGIPMGGTSDYVSKTSFRGFGIEGRGFITDYLSYGGSFNWAVFYDEVGPELFTGEDNATVYGKQFRYINSYPIMGTMHYYFGEWDETRFYAGGGIGAHSINQRTDVGLYSIKNNYWTFGLAPEIGVLIPINYNSAFNLAVKYQYGVKTSKGDAFSSLTFKIGFAFM